jgi:hypothetical protein
MAGEYMKPKFKEGDQVNIIAANPATVVEVVRVNGVIIYTVEWPDSKGGINEGSFEAGDLHQVTTNTL